MRNQPHREFSFTLDAEQLHRADWADRSGNPLARCIAAVLPPDTVVYVDLQPQEYYVRRGDCAGWYDLPDELSMAVYHARQAPEARQEVAPITFTLWLPDALFAT